MKVYFIIHLFGRFKICCRAPRAVIKQYLKYLTIRRSYERSDETEDNNIILFWLFIWIGAQKHTGNPGSPIPPFSPGIPGSPSSPFEPLSPYKWDGLHVRIILSLDSDILGNTEFQINFVSRWVLCKDDSDFHFSVELFLVATFYIQSTLLPCVIEGIGFYHSGHVSMKNMNLGVDITSPDLIFFTWQLILYHRSWKQCNGLILNSKVHIWTRI